MDAGQGHRPIRTLASRALALAGALALSAAAPAAADTISAQAQFQAFSPQQLDVLTGDTVQWTNVSDRTHTVTADDGSFASELPGGTTFAEPFGAVGHFAYHCTIHPGMTGEVDVWRVILQPLPPAAVPAGEPVRLTGRAADTQSPVTIERDAGSGFTPVAHTLPAPDGSWSVDVPAETTADYRAVSGLDASETRRLLVIDRHVDVTRTKHGVDVTVTPADPHALVLLERDLRLRFGWWPTARARLDYLSRAHFRLRHPARVRVLLVDRDGWTALATSPVLTRRR